MSAQVQGRDLHICPQVLAHVLEVLKGCGESYRELPRSVQEVHEDLTRGYENSGAPLNHLARAA